MPCPGCLGRVPRDRPGSCGQHLQGNTHHGDFLEARVPTRSGLPDNAHWQQGPWKSNGGWGWCPPTRHSEKHECLRRTGAGSYMGGLNVLILVP